MRWSEVIELLTPTETQNSYGEAIEGDPVIHEVFANKKSIRQTEFYQAQTAGLKPEIMFEIRTMDYNNEPQLKYGADIYFIIRTYDKNGEIMELICSRHPMR